MRKCDIDKEKTCLPDIIECENVLDVNSYMDNLYNNVFKKDFIDSQPEFMGERVFIRREPMDGDKEHGFIHMTHENFQHKSKEPNDRVPDFRRSERLVWVKPIIQNYEESLVKKCGNILYWEEMFRGRVRNCLLFEDERFLVVLERNKNGYFIITSFYLEKDWELEKRKQKVIKYEKQKTPLA